MKLQPNAFILSLGMIAIIIIANSTENYNAQAEEQPSVKLVDGDTVAFVGATQIERMQNGGDFETLMTLRMTDRNVRFRNLGWSGDNARAHSRAVFGAPDDGLKRLLSDLEIAKPTMIVVSYGTNAAFAGPGGLPQFEADLGRLLDALKPLGARLVLLSPTQRETLGPTLPDATTYNEHLKLYTAVIAKEAKKREITMIDFQSPLVAENLRNSSSPLTTLTDNGIHFTPFGHWRTAPKLANHFDAKEQPWEIAIDCAKNENKVVSEEGARLKDVIAKKDAVKFTAIDAQLPPPLPPKFSPTGAELLLSQATLTITGLAPGKYGLKVDGKPVVVATDEHWAKGVAFRRSYADEQVAKLQAAINRKNLMFFYRHRPQNETYLFLFRKHEQGNNAVEIPSFDPLIAEAEVEISKLKLPTEHRFELERVEFEDAKAEE